MIGWLLLLKGRAPAGSNLPRTTRSILGAILGGLLLAAPLSAAPQQAKAPALKFAVPFVENDYAKALADAQRRNVQLFVDAWAPW